MITLIFRPIRQQINGIVMAAGGSEDTRYWEKVYDSPPQKKTNLDSLFIVKNFSKSGC